VVVSPGVAPGVWSRATFTPAAAPAGAVAVDVRIELRHPDGVTVGGEQSWIQDAQVDEGPVALPYRDGEMGSDGVPGGLASVWDGTAFASPTTTRILTQAPPVWVPEPVTR